MKESLKDIIKSLRELDRKAAKTAIAVEGEFDLFRLSKSKEIVDICSNTLRGYFRQGLPHYKHGKAVYVSKRELQIFIMRDNPKRRIP